MWGRSFISSFPIVATVVLTGGGVSGEELPFVTTLQPTTVPSSSPTVLLVPPTMAPSPSPSESPSDQPTDLPTDQPSSGPTTAPSTDPTTSPSTDPTTAPSEPTTGTIDLDEWSVLQVGGQPQVFVGREPTLYARVESNFLLSSTDIVNHVQVSIYPRDQCGLGSPVLVGSGAVCPDDDDDETACPKNVATGDQVVYKAIFDIPNLEESDYWDEESRMAEFCGRFALIKEDILVSYSDMNFEFQIDLNATFAVTNMQATSFDLNTLVKNFVYVVSACICDNSNVCYSTLPAFPLGADVRVCIEPPPEEDVEIDNVWEWKVEQTESGVLRYAVMYGEYDPLTAKETTTGSNKVVVRTSLDAAFFDAPEYGVKLTGVVLMKPTSSVRRTRRHLKPNVTRTSQNNNIFQEPVEGGIFQIQLDLLATEPVRVFGRLADAVIITMACVALLVGAAVYWHKKRTVGIAQMLDNDDEEDGQSLVFD